MTNKMTYFIGKKLAKEVADELINKINKGFVDEIELKARGRYISKAVDVLEIIKRELDISHQIETKTDELFPEMQMGVTNYGTERESINVSKIIIRVKKK